MGLKIINWNARGVKSKKIEISEKIKNYDIIGLTETKLSYKDNIRFTDYNIYRNDGLQSRTNGSGGVMLLVKKGISQSRLQNFQTTSRNIDCVGAVIHGVRYDIKILVIYRKPGYVEKNGTWRKMINKFKDSKIIMMGDFNAHNVLWNCHCTDRNGSCLAEESEEEGLYVMNIDTTSRIGEGGRQWSNLDLMFCTSEMVHRITYKQGKDTWGSDHFPIIYEIDEEMKGYFKKTNRITNKKTDWEQYDELMESGLEKIKQVQQNNVNHIEVYQELYETMISAAAIATGKNYGEIEDSTDKKYKCRRKNPVEWWDDDCQKAVYNRKEKLAKLKESYHMNDYIEYKKAKAEATRIINRKKRDNFKKFITTINKNTNMTYVWNKMKVLKKSSKTVEWNKWQKKDRNKECGKVMHELSPSWVCEQRIIINENEIDKENELDRDIVVEETRRAVNSCRITSAPGIDKVEYIMIKRLSDEYMGIITDIFNGCVKTGIFPEQWKEYQVIFIDKPGKEKVRPIALASCMSKVLERIMTERINWWAETNNILNKKQNGFRKGRSCIENLIQLVTDIRIGYHNGENTMGAFLDVTSAYDNVLYAPLMKKLIEEKCPYQITKYVEAWMSGRIVKFIVNNETVETRHTYKGLPQGGVLSPILYDIYTNKITDNLPNGVEQIQFADDIAIYIMEKNYKEREMKIKSAIGIIKKNLEQIGLELQPNKTVIVDFDCKVNKRKNQIINILGENIELKKEAKFLGIILDYRLTFEAQSANIKEKATKANAMLRYVNGIKKGMEVNTALMLYKSLVRSTIDYGAFIYYPGDEKNSIKIERAQYRGLRTAMGYRNSTPNNVILGETKIMKVSDRAEMMARNFMLKILIYGDDELKNKLTILNRMERRNRGDRLYRRKPPISCEAWNRVVEDKNKIKERGQFEVFEMEYWQSTLNMNIETNIGKKIKKGKKIGQITQEIIEKYEMENKPTIIFTDGSRSEDKISTGSAYYIPEEEMGYMVSLEKSCSNYTAEAVAIVKSMQLMINQKSKKDIIIYSDALSVLQAIMNNKISVYVNRYILEIRRKYFELKKEKDREGKKIVICWVPAHIGVEGNEIADQLAKEATSEEHSEELEVPYEDLKSTYKKEMYEKTVTKIIQQGRMKGREYFSNFYKRDESKPWFNGMNKSRQYITWINRMRSNHYNLNESLARVGYISSARCSCGYEVEDINHFVFECRNYDEIRSDYNLNGKLNNIKASRPDCVWNWLKKGELKTLEVIYKYIVKTKKVI